MKKTRSLEPILKVRNLKQYFKTGMGKNKLVVKAVDDVSFDVYPGEVFALVGESGCGKTTTGRTIIKLYKPTDGDIYFKDVRISAGNERQKQKIKDIKADAREKMQGILAHFRDKTNPLSPDKQAQYKEEMKAIRSAALDQIAEIKKDMAIREKETNNPDTELMRKMQMIFQDPIESLNPRMTVKEIIAEGLRIAGERDDNLIQEKVHQVLETVGLLPEHASRYPHEFSGGQRQRIGIARALVVNPELIIADEPISALDVSIQAQVINLLNDLREELNLTLLFIAHDLSVVKYFSDRIGVMYYGKLVELAPKEELFKNPFHPYTKSLLSAVPVPDPNYEKSRPARIKYDPRSHNYTKDDMPILREITKGHFILSNEKEFKQHQSNLKV
jgi:oligopeptide transport system ATP-binding protein